MLYDDINNNDNIIKKAAETQSTSCGRKIRNYSKRKVRVKMRCKKVIKNHVCLFKRLILMYVLF